MIPRLRSEDGIPHDVADLLQALAGTPFAGDVRTDAAARLVAATDNSVYQVLPAAVVFPTCTADVSALLALGDEPRFRHIAMSPRGGGTGTNGQSLTGGIVIDLSRHMDRILGVDLEAGTVTVQPGVVLDQLNRHLLPTGTFFAPSLSPSNRATLGGMISTDACGKGSRIYGRTSDHVLSMDVVLHDGTVWRCAPLDEAALELACRGDDAPGRALRTTRDVVRARKALIDATFPKLQRFMTGYNLAMVDGPRGFDPCRLVAGAEGTLGVVTEATLRLTALPRHKRLVLLRYGSFDDALADAGALLAHDPSAIETIDETVMDLARGDIIYHRVGHMLDVPGQPPPRTINLVELVGDDPAALDARVRAIVSQTGRPAARPTGAHVATGEEAKALWDLRKKGVGLLGNAPGDRRPVPFVEDTVVPPERLAEYVREFRAILDRHGLRYGMFGHVDVGCLHVRPALDLLDPAQERLLRRISDEVSALTARYGGMMWGEHGKGYRSEYNPDFFGPELYRELCRIKGAFDPHDRLNPGKIATPLGSPGGLVSVDGPKRGAWDRRIAPALRERHAVAIRCNGNAACFDWDADTVMCPSWKGTRDRVHSPKGRATVMREWMRRLSEAGWSPDDARGSFVDRAVNTFERAHGEGDFSHEVHAAMDGCLSCKACATQCPIKVDVPAMKADFLDHYHRRYLRPPKDWLLAALEPSLPLASRLPGLFNAVMGSPPARGALRALGVVDTPPVAPVPLRRGLRERGLDRYEPPPKETGVIVVQDAFTTFYEPHVVLAVVDLLRALGFTPAVLPWFESGKGLHVKGMLGRFRKVARRAAARLTEAAATGLPLVGIEPAVVLALRQEVPEAAGVADPPWRVHLLQEWLAPRVPPRPLPPGRWMLLGHCTEKALEPPSQQAWVTLFRALGQELRTEPVGCCGMSGMYGHEAAHAETSRAIWDAGWATHLPADPAARARVLATGTSCRSQAKRFAEARLRHPAEALAELLGAP